MVSNAIRFDPLLTRYVAGELDERLRGRNCAAFPLFGPDRSVSLPFSGGETLSAELHPTRGRILLLPDSHPEAELDAVCTRVHAPEDERIIPSSWRT
jgi:hypothetical protein